MYFARLRTLMNDILGTNFIERYVAKILKKIRQDALRDSVKWKVGGIRSIDQGVLQLLSQSVKLRREQLFKTYSNMIPKTVAEREILKNVKVHIRAGHLQLCFTFLKVSRLLFLVREQLRLT